MIKVIPYEYKGKLIREMKVNTIEEVTKVKEMLIQENDKWLKKLLSLRLLEYDNLELLKINRSEIINIAKCQIDY